ncbi:MAG: cytochrome ubiquinol oxidase subunit I [Polyangiaceae bacterium]|nr:cytochrome ubiquinol oxidase subunit I [Polyangiaceae bacterium]
MNYPVWDVPGLGAGLVVAIIAIFHVLVSHIAVGGGAFLFVAELWARRQPEKERILAWLKRYVVFFLVFTTVFGAITGVGIWFSIQLASPEATSLLIHQFVFAWAIEWVAFLGELTVLYLYYYGWSANPERRRVLLAGAYFGIAWMSLVVINGILTFMLTPGGWTLESHDIAAGFFNPGYFPALGLRTVVMFLLAGLSAFVVAGRIDAKDSLKPRIVRFAAYWVIPAAVLIPLFSYAYWATLPSLTTQLAQEGVAGLAGGKLEVMARALMLAGATAVLILVGTLSFAVRPRAVTMGAAVALLGTAQLGIAGAEFFREMARKPYVVHGVLYSNALWAKEAKPATLTKPFLSRAHWHPQTQPLTRARGEWIYRLQCASCHTRGGYRSLEQRTATWTPEFGFKWLETMNATGVMPPFQGDAEDRAALTSYLLSLNGRKVDPAAILNPPPSKAAVVQARLEEVTP